MSDDYLLDAAWEHRDMILRAYKQFEKQRPIVLFDIQEQRIYLHQYEGFKEELKPKDQAPLQDQYERASTTNKIVVFVRDNENRRLVSYSWDDPRATRPGGDRVWRRKKPRVK
jgi:hypothetical protein